ncbi:MAG: MFS transporter [Candidatus Hermodarchaeota archaeon]
MTENKSILSILFLVIVIALINATQYMIYPNLLKISNYFGFGNNITPLGILTFTFILVSGIFMLIFGYLADRFVRKWILILGILTFSVSSSFTLLVTPDLSGYYLLFLITCLNGVGFGAIIPSSFSLIGDLITHENRSKGLSFFSIASLFGMVIGIGLGTLVSNYDWRFSFFIVGVMGLIIALIFLFFKEPSRIGKDFSREADKNHIEYSYRIKKSDLRVIFKKKSNKWLVINFVDTIPTGIILFLLFAYMEKYHNLSGTITLILLSTTLISTLIGTIIFGIIGDKNFKKGNKRARVNLALMGNIFPIPFVFIALIIPFRAPDNVSVADAFMIPGLILMMLLLAIGLFINGAVNGNWYATIVDLNLPEHRATVLSTANFFDVFGRALGPLLGAIVADTFGFLYGIAVSILFWIFIPLFWITVVKNVVQEIEITEKIFSERINKIKNLNQNYRM